MTTTKNDYEKAVSDMEDLVSSTAELIDMHFTQFAEFLEGKNIGTLKAYRTLLERNLVQADNIAKTFIESKLVNFTETERIQLGSVFGAISKIIDRIGYIDFLIKKNDLDFAK